MQRLKTPKSPKVTLEDRTKAVMETMMSRTKEALEDGLIGRTKAMATGMLGFWTKNYCSGVSAAWKIRTDKKKMRTERRAALKLERPKPLVFPQFVPYHQNSNLLDNSTLFRQLLICVKKMTLLSSWEELELYVVRS